MKYSSIPLAQAVVSQCKNELIKHIIISPGSRNAPLILSFTSDSFFKCYSVVDERSAAFFALGMAQQLNEPVALVCTSGSALLNYYPAITEAYYSQIPLVVLSADRPEYLIDRGDGQTIRQKNVFANHIGLQAHLQQDLTHSFAKVKTYQQNVPEDPNELHEAQKILHQTNKNTVKEALVYAKKNQLPVHLNIPFEEPLYKTVEVQLAPRKATALSNISDKIPDSLLVSSLEKHPKVMVLVGVLAPNTIKEEQLKSLAESNALVLTETTSNLCSDSFVSSIDSLIAPIEKAPNSADLFEHLQPDLLITFGGAIVSKKIKSFLREHPPKSHWHIGYESARDTYFCLKENFKMSQGDFIDQLVQHPSKTPYKNHWVNEYKQLLKQADSFVIQAPFSDFKVHNTIVNNLPKGTLVHYSNSTAIRYSQLFPPICKVSIYCNRGTSGIDGSTSTAVGASWIHKKLSVLVSGDLSFFYDSNAFWNRYVSPNFRVILLNNQGGGIFRILPTGKEDEAFESFFETPHLLKAKDLCSLYGLEYRSASDLESSEVELTRLFEPTEKAVILEIFTPRKVNDLVLNGYFETLSKNVFSKE